MLVIGKAKLIWDKFLQFAESEKEHSDKRELGWYTDVRYKVPPEIDRIIWDNYEKTGEHHDPVGVICIISQYCIDTVKEHLDYLESMDLPWDLIYYDKGVAVIRSGDFQLGIPKSAVEYQLFQNLDNYTLAQLKGAAKTEFSLISQDDISKKDMNQKLQDKQAEIKAKEDEIKKIQEEKKAELERIRLKLEKKYAEQMQLIEAKKAEIEHQKDILEKQMFLLDTELYSIRCFMGEIIDFVPLLKGNYSRTEEPLMFYQKVRYLDEELGKWLSIYGFDGSTEDISYFEDALKHREDLRELFAPGPKSISIVKISKNGVSYGASGWVANTLDVYKKYHGQQIGILVRDGENLWAGWTDEKRIQIHDGNVFLKPETKEQSVDEAVGVSDTKEEKASRYFIFSILQGLIQNGKLFHIPDGVNILKPNPYIILSMADGWLEDNRYGTFSDIVNRTDAPLSVGDMILTTNRITRDDAGIGNIWNNGRTTRYDKFNNDRGRGEKNRTHDASIPDRKIVPVNLIDTHEDYAVYWKKYRLEVTKIPSPPVREGNLTVTNYHYEKKKTNEYLGMEKTYLKVDNHRLFYQVPVKGKSPEEIFQTALIYGYVCKEQECIISETEKCYLMVYDHIEFDGCERNCFVSAIKSNWSEKVSYANMEIFDDEYLNLTYLNSIYLTYAIQNRKIGGWRRAGAVVDYADSLPYLHTALEYLRKREKEEAAMLEKHMTLYDGWQVDLSEWRLEHNYHRLTETRARKFAKERQTATAEL